MFPYSSATLGVPFREMAVSVAAEASALAWSQVPLLATVFANPLHQNRGEKMHQLRLHLHHDLVPPHLPVVQRGQVLDLVPLLLLLPRLPSLIQLSVPFLDCIRQ